MLSKQYIITINYIMTNQHIKLYEKVESTS